MKNICTNCGSGEYYCKGMCKRCYIKQLVPARWCKKFDVCIRCGSSEYPHVAKGLCSRCYATQETAYLCSCGCGLPVAKVGNKVRKYRKGHWMKNNKGFMDAHINAFTGINNPMFGKFGKEHPAFGHKTKPEVREQRRERRISYMSERGVVTKIEIALCEILDEIGVVHQSQKSLYNKFSVDEYLPESRVVIEAHGGYWHGDKRKFKNLSELQKKIKAKDVSKHRYLNTCGHRVLVLWEKELTFDREWCKKEILLAIKNQRIPEVQCSVYAKSF